jgi:hypothetical protein
VSVRVLIHQPGPDRTLAVWLDSTPDLSCPNGIRAHGVDVEHQPTDLVLRWSVRSAVRATACAALALLTPGFSIEVVWDCWRATVSLVACADHRCRR